MVSSMSPSVTPALACGQFLRLFHFETLMWQTTERAAIKLASQLDSGDFILGPRLQLVAYGYVLSCSACSVCGRKNLAS